MITIYSKITGLPVFQVSTESEAETIIQAGGLFYFVDCPLDDTQANYGGTE